MYHNFRVTLHWFADNKEWRIYTDAGQYVTAKGIDEIPQQLSQLLLISADATSRMQGLVKDAQGK